MASLVLSEQRSWVSLSTTQNAAFHWDRAEKTAAVPVMLNVYPAGLPNTRPGDVRIPGASRVALITTRLCTYQCYHYQDCA